MKKRLIIDGLLLAVTLCLLFVTGKDATEKRGTLPSISPNYLLNGTKLDSNPDPIFDYYDIGNDEYAISLKDSIRTTYSSAITIPAEYNGKKVTGIWHNAFHDNPATSITFESPSNIHIIDFEAFLYSRVQTISIPYTVTAIGDAAFYSCNSLTTVTFVNSSQTTSAGGACSCDSVEEVEEEEEEVQYSSLSKIPSFCFFKCQLLESVSFPTSLLEIGEDAFNGCASITSPLFFQRIKIIRARAFQGCIGLTSVFVPKTLFEDDDGDGIEPHAFNYCDTSLEFVFCGTDEKIDAWVAKHPNWGWRLDANPTLTPDSSNPTRLGRYSITRRETGDTYFTSDWSYSVDSQGNVTLKSYNGPTPTAAKNYLISIPDTMPGEPANNKVRRIDVGVFTPTVKAAIRRLYLPTTLWAIENKMFASGYTNLYIIDDNTACISDVGYSDSNNVPGRIDLSGLTELEFIGVHAFARSGGGLPKKNRIKLVHLPANLRSIGDEAFGVFQNRMLPNVEEFIWDYNETTSRLETIGADCFYGIGDNGSGQIRGNVEWRSHKSSTIVFPKTFKYFGILQSDEDIYRAQAKNPFNFQLFNGEAEKGARWERPAHAFAGCSLISTVIFKGDSEDSTKTTDLLIPLQTFVYNESLHTIIFEERKEHYITFHTQQGTTKNQDYSQESIGGNSGRGENDFRGEPFLQTIVLPNKLTKLRIQKFAFHANSRAAMYFSGSENTNIFSDRNNGWWRESVMNNSFDVDNTDMTRAERWKSIGDEGWTGATAYNNDGKGYYGYNFTPNKTSTSAYTNTDSFNTFSINQEIPAYYNVHYSENIQLYSGSVNVEVGGGTGCKELVLDNKVITEPSTVYPSYCAYVCETDTARPEGSQNIATMSKYLYDIKESDREVSIRRDPLRKKTARILDSVTVNNKSYRVVKIGDSAFSADFCDSKLDSALGDVGDFDDLKYVELPDSIETIGEYAFIRCYGVEKISAYTSGSASAANYEMPAKLRHIGKNAFLFSGLKEARKIHVDCRFYENENATNKITSVFANCLSLRVITFTTSNDRSSETTYTDYYETTTYTSSSGTYTSALYSTNSSGIAQNKNKLLLVLNRDSSDVNKASVDHSSNAECTVSGDGVKFDGSLKEGAYLFGAYKMGMWIKELKYGTDSDDDGGAQPLFSAVGERKGKTLTPVYFYLYSNAIPFDTMDCDLDTIEGKVLSLPKYALKGCENLSTVVLPDAGAGDPTVIPDGLFSEATDANFVTSGLEGSTAGVMDLSTTGYTMIGKESIKGNTTITKLIAPAVSSFTIGESAFASCSNLATLDLSGVTGTLIISKNAFASTAVNGINITWPSSPCIIKIESEGAFKNCTSMTSINLPTNMTATLGSSTFEGCSNLATVTTSGTSPIVTIGSSAFKGCSNLTSFPFSSLTSLTTISASAFENAGSLSASAIELPASLTTINESAFQSSAITSVVFNSNVEISLSKYAFKLCTSLTSVVFKSACNWKNNGYGQGVFNDCTSLTELQLPTGFDINNSKYTGSGTDDTKYFVLNDSNVKIYTHKKFTSSTSVNNTGWRRTSTSGSEAVLYFFLDSNAITDLTNANVIDENGVKNGTTHFWTTDANGHAIPLGTVSSYSGGVITFSSGYTFDTTNGYVSH